MLLPPVAIGLPLPTVVVVVDATLVVVVATLVVVVPALVVVVPALVVVVPDGARHRQQSVTMSDRRPSHHHRCPC